MKKHLCIFLSAVLIFSVLSFSACQKKQPEEQTTTEKVYEYSTRATTATPMKITAVPTSKEEQLEMFNAALDYVELYCYGYSKVVKCKVDNVNVGTLSAVPNAADAFRSIFGEKETVTDYSYKISQEKFSDNMIKSGFTDADISLIDAKKEDNMIILTINFPDENNPTTETGHLCILSTDYLSTEDVTENLKDFNSSAESVNIAVSGITVKATISCFDSSLYKLEVSYSETYTLGGVKLVKLDGSSVSGTSNTVITYSGIK